MKLVAAILVLTLTSNATFADEDHASAIQKIQQERLTLLEHRAAQAARDFSEGEATAMELFRTEMALLKLQRRFAPRGAERRAIQEKLVTTREKHVTYLRRHFLAGDSSVSAAQVAKAKADVLAERQKLLEMGAKAKANEKSKTAAKAKSDATTDTGTASKPKPNPAITPQPRIEDWWFARQAEKIGEMKDGTFDVLMVGDSITHNFESQGKSAWEKHLAPLKAINLGFGGDRTNHVLWRLNHLPKLKTAPKVAVVLIGTNNICWGSDEPKEAAVGVAAVAEKLHNLYPDMKVLVLAVFPRREKPDHPHRKEIVELNACLPDLLKDVKSASLLDIGEKFLDENGILSREMMPDTTHPSEAAHEIWAQAMVPEIKKLMQNSDK